MSKLINHLKDESILITGHINPDGDALGSALALKLIFQSKGIESDVYFDKTTKFPNTLNHLPLHFINEEIKDKYDTVYVFDCGSSSRLGVVEKVALDSNKVIVVDHHINPTFGDIQIIDSNAASTTQVLYRELVNEKKLITKEVANCLMTGLITDTGRFQYSNTTSEVLSIAAALVDFGAEVAVISENIYGTKNLNAMNLESEVVNRINVHDEEKLVCSYVLQEDYSKFNIDESEMDFLIDSIRLVEGTNVALLLKEQKDGTYKASLRSRSSINVQQVASSFNGGGHKAASGFSSSLNQDEIVNQVKMKLELNSNFYLADKPKTWTSQDLCTKFRKNYKFGKVGHSGTLDPLATGLMLLATNKYTKLFDYIDDTTKNYRVEALLGFESETLDIMSEVTKKEDVVAVDRSDDIKKFFKTKLGKSKQQPPKYSAVKVKGKRLYKYARQNKDVDIPMRDIEIFNIENISYNLNIVTFDIKVSKGTYIRSIVRELGEFINTTAIVNNLKRINIGSLSSEDSRLISNVEALKKDSHIESIHWSEIIGLKELKVKENQIENIRNGNLIDSSEFSSREKFAISFENNLVAIYEPFSEDFFKPDKVFI